VVERRQYRVAEGYGVGYENGCSLPIGVGSVVGCAVFQKKKNVLEPIHFGAFSVAKEAARQMDREQYTKLFYFSSFVCMRVHYGVRNDDAKPMR